MGIANGGTANGVHIAKVGSKGGIANGVANRSIANRANRKGIANSSVPYADAHIPYYKIVVSIFFSTIPIYPLYNT